MLDGIGLVTPQTLVQTVYTEQHGSPDTSCQRENTLGDGRWVFKVEDDSHGLGLVHWTKKRYDDHARDRS